MPAMITHYLFGVDSYHALTSPQLKSMLRDNIGPYRIGLQGPDIFFYHPLCAFLPKHRHIGSQMHESKVQTFFSSYLKICETLAASVRPAAYSYFLGLTAHYVLDSSIHPYIYYRSGYIPADPASASACLGKHQELETYIDCALVKHRRKMKPSEFHASKTIHLTPNEFSTLTYVLSHAIKAAYPERWFPCTGRTGTGFAFFSTKTAASILHSQRGRRKALLDTLEHRLFQHPVLSNAVHWDGITDCNDTFNLAHNVWHNPWLKQHSSNFGINDLYQEALQRYAAILPHFSAYINANASAYEQKRMPLLKEIGNRSYHSGITCV